MNLKPFLKKYEAVLVDESKLSAYEKFAFKLFHDRKIVSDPNLEITIQLDITDADRAYREKFSSAKGASFTAYLSWCLIQAMNAHAPFRYREVDGKWYEFGNLPLFFPVAVAGKERFGEVLIEGASKFTWEEFSEKYREAVDLCMQTGAVYVPASLESWHLSNFIGNLPNLQFTHFSLHSSSQDRGRPQFYFGKRYELGGRKFVPFYVRFDHANLDPQLVGRLVNDFELIASDQLA